MSISSTIKYCLYITFLNILLLCHCGYPVDIKRHFANSFKIILMEKWFVCTFGIKEQLLLTLFLHYVTWAERVQSPARAWCHITNYRSSEASSLFSIQSSLQRHWCRKLSEKKSQPRGQTGVNLWVAFNRWWELHEVKGCKTDAEPAFSLFDYLVILTGLLCLVLLQLLDVWLSCWLNNFLIISHVSSRSIFKCFMEQNPVLLLYPVRWHGSLVSDHDFAGSKSFSLATITSVQLSKTGESRRDYYFQQWCKSELPSKTAEAPSHKNTISFIIGI